jgi:hypothetical protein
VKSCFGASQCQPIQVVVEFLIRGFWTIHSLPIEVVFRTQIVLQHDRGCQPQQQSSIAQKINCFLENKIFFLRIGVWGVFVFMASVLVVECNYWAVVVNGFDGVKISWRLFAVSPDCRGASWYELSGPSGWKCRQFDERLLPPRWVSEFIRNVRRLNFVNGNPIIRHCTLPEEASVTSSANQVTY